MTNQKSRIDWKQGDVAVIKKEWEGEGGKLQVLGPAIYVAQWWVPVIDPEDGDPTFVKEASIEMIVAVS